MPDLELRHWMVAGALFWAVLIAGVILGSFLAPRETPVVRKDPRYECLCPDSLQEPGPRSLRTERN